MVVRRSEAEHNGLMPPPQWPPLCRGPSKPRCFVDRFPLARRLAEPTHGAHPLPLALAEVEQLREVEQGAGAADLELPALSGSWPVVITPCPEDDSFAASPLVRSGASDVDETLRMALCVVLVDVLKVLRPAKGFSSARLGFDPSEASRGLLGDAELDVLLRSVLHG